MTVWPYLLAGSAICAYWNWRAAIIFALAVGVGQAITRLELTQVHLLAGYSLLAVVATFFFDRYSGFIMATFGLVIGAHLFGLIAHFPKVVIGEMLLIAGMLFCGINGPSGGLWDGDNSASGAGRDTVLDAGSTAVSRGQMPSDENSRP